MLFQAVILIFVLHIDISFCAKLSEERQACRTEEITYIPDEFDFYEEPVMLSFDSSLSFNHMLVSRMVEEECGLRDKGFSLWKQREKRSPVAKGIHRLGKYFLHIYQRNKNILKPEVIRGIKRLVEKLNHLNRPMEKARFSGIGKFFFEVWKDLQKVKEEAKDEHFDELLEKTFRTSIHLLTQNGKLTEMILNNPDILFKIRRRIPVDNAVLLSTVEATNIRCRQSNRDSQVVILLKLKIPKIKTVTINKCDDIGSMDNGNYQYYKLPAATFNQNGKDFKVDISKCTKENFIFCPKEAIRPTSCSIENVEECVLREEITPMSFERELQYGFAVFGNFTRVVTKKGEMILLYVIHPRRLYHIVPQSDEIIHIGDRELIQATGSNETLLRPIK